MEKNDLVILNVSPVSFYKEIVKVLFNTSILIFAAFFVFFVLSSSGMKQFVLNNIGIAILIYIIFITIVALLQRINGVTYIYYVKLTNNEIFLKWQEWKEFHELTVVKEGVECSVEPSGKDSLYLMITLKTPERTYVIKQTNYPNWNNDTMRSFVSTVKNYFAS